MKWHARIWNLLGKGSSNQGARQWLQGPLMRAAAWRAYLAKVAEIPVAEMVEVFGNALDVVGCVGRGKVGARQGVATVT